MLTAAHVSDCATLDFTGESCRSDEILLVRNLRHLVALHSIQSLSFSLHYVALILPLLLPTIQLGRRGKLSSFTVLADSIDCKSNFLI